MWIIIYSNRQHRLVQDFRERDEKMVKAGKPLTKNGRCSRTRKLSVIKQRPKWES